MQIKNNTTIKKSIALWLGCFICISFCHAQLDYSYTEGKFLIKGVVMDVETKRPVPMVNVRLNSSNRGTTADADGAFMMYVSIKDTLKFTSTGYLSKTIHIVDLDSNRYSLIQIELIHDFVKLKDVNIYPYRDLDAFKYKFTNTRVGQFLVNGIPAAKYSNKIPKANLGNPISFLYERLKHRSNANPDF